MDEKVLPSKGVPSLRQDEESDEIHSESSSDEVYVFRRQDSGRLRTSEEPQKSSKIETSQLI